jgi:N-acetylmuramoyl-L-alanine amidase
MRRWFQFSLCVGLIGSLALRGAPVAAGQALPWRELWEQRYAPHVPFPEGGLSPLPAGVAPWWEAPETLRAGRVAGQGPLEGLHLAIDPGHIGGLWAGLEGRRFRIDAGDHWVCEGDLVLELALRLRTRLQSLGAVVTLTREGPRPVNPRGYLHYWSQAAAASGQPLPGAGKREQWAYVKALSDRARRLAFVIGELAERARQINTSVRPDALISLHINAAPWPRPEAPSLVASDHAHVLIFGCVTPDEIKRPAQKARLWTKMRNGSGAIEIALGAALGRALALATDLPASEYEGRNAVRIDPSIPQVWARNLMLLRLVDGPTVLLEPYIANSMTTYPRLQAAIDNRRHHRPLGDEDILIEYADAVVAGLLEVYAGPR